MFGLGELADPAAHSSGSASELDARQDLGWIVALSLFAWGVRLVTLFRTSVIVNDGPTFLRITQNMLDGNWGLAFSAHQHPGYPLLTAGLSAWVGDLLTAAQWVSLVAGSLAVAALYCFLIQAWNRRVAVLGAFLLAINPYAARLSADVQSDALYLFLFLSAIGFIFGALRTRRSSLAWAAGLVAGLAYGVRPEGVGVVIVGIGLALTAWLRGTWSLGTLLRWVMALTLGAAAVMVPYLIVLRGVTGGITLSQKKSVLSMLGWV
ncbi:MAG: glycosyltransferase family 39 protein, partial [Myxococcota bacterium]|nr:glycosyltransferase family 39 protein [Myxococcota bacterium]